VDARGLGTAVEGDDGGARAVELPLRPPRIASTAWRYKWVIAWFTGIAVFIWGWGFPGSRTEVFTIVGLGLIVSGTTSSAESSWKRVIIDWLPFYLLLTAYDMLRGSAGKWLMPHVLPQIRIDESLFGGTAPTVMLQHALYTPGVARPWDYLAFVVYMTHFVAPFVIAGFLWKFAHDRFRRYSALLIGLTFAALVTYVLYPAVPPWMASQNAYLPPTAKIIDEMWTHIGVSNGSSVFSATGHFADPVAAVPSLHSAYPMLLLLFFWKSAGRWRWLLALYPLAMGFALVYTGEHFVIDVLLGWLYAVVIFVFGNRLFDRYELRRTAKSRIESSSPELITALA
jgi:membrane-associated phospholipid phosphatase